MEKINILYIDDNVAEGLEEYLKTNYNNDNFNYETKKFKLNDTYVDLLEDNSVKKANIIVIDSRLFEDRNVKNTKFTGEEFQIILKKCYPYIETILISRNDRTDIKFVKKYSDSGGISELEYYEQKLKPEIEKACDDVKIYRILSKKLAKSKSVDKVLIDQVIGSLKGSNDYQKLTTKDIDKVIKLFNEIKNS